MTTTEEEPTGLEPTPSAGQPPEALDNTPEDDGTPPDIPETTPMMGAQTKSLKDFDPSDDLYVPVTNVNYIPEIEGAEIRQPKPGEPIGSVLQGYVPDHPGNDPTLVRIKMALEAQGHTSGPEEDNPGGGPPADEPVEPTEEDNEPTTFQ